MKVRYKVLGDAVSVVADTWRTERELPLCRAIATRILQLAAVAVSRKRRVAHALDTALGVDWLGRSQLYSRSEASVVALAMDLKLARDARVGEPTRSAREDYLLTSLYWFTLANLLDEERHVIFGGDWLMVDALQEEYAADTYYRITAALAPFGQRQVSRLRILLRNVPHWELETFVLAVLAQEPELLQIWKAWEAACDCEVDDLPQEDCRVHELRETVVTFSESVRAHWNELTDWYPAIGDSPTDAQAEPWEQGHPRR